MNGAFSEKNPNVQLVWDASSLKNYQFCPRYYEYSNLQGWRGDSVDLDFGRMIADGFEHFKKHRLDGLSREDATIAVVKEAMEATYNEADGTQWGGKYVDVWKCEGTKPYKNEKGNRAKCPQAWDAFWGEGEAPDICVHCGDGIRQERQYAPNHKTKNRQTLIRALVWYGLQQPEEIADGLRPYVFDDGRAAVELSGKMPLPFTTAGGEQYVFAYNLDYIGQWGDELFIVDNKTTSKPLNDMYYSGFAVDTQFDSYDLIGSMMFPDLPIRGTMVEAVSLSAQGVDIGLRPFYKTEAQREEHLNDLGEWIADAERSAEAGYWRMNKRSCWLCPMKAVCAQSPKMRDGYLRSNYEKGPRWDPSHER